MPQHHGYSKTREYEFWINLRARIRNKNQEVICDRWNNSFPEFLKDTGRKPAEGYYLTLKNPDLGWIPNNTRWNKPSKNYKRNYHYEFHVKVVYDSEQLIVADLADKIGMSQKLLLSRLRSGMDLAKATRLLNYKTGKPLPKIPTY